MTKNIITIDLPPHLADYCRHEFGVDNEENIILRRSHDIGKQIYSHILTADLPPKQLPGLHPTPFIIPVTKSNRYILGSRFLYISRWGEEKYRTTSKPTSTSGYGSCSKPVTGKTTPRSKSLRPFSRHTTSKTHHLITRQ